MDKFPFTAEQVINLLGLKAKAQGNEYLCICHLPGCSDKSGNLSINKLNDKVRCWKCGYVGNTMTLYAELTGMTNKEAYADIMRRLNLNTLEKPKLRKLVEEREKVSQDADNVPLREIKERDTTYQALLDAIPLKKEHMKHLMSRGFEEYCIYANGYKSTLQEDTLNITKQLAESGLYFEGVPGFYQNKYKGNAWDFVKSKKGIYIPVRDSQNRIQGMQFRLDDDAREVDSNGKLEQKYRWISSKYFKGGCGATSFVHYATDFHWDAQKHANVPVLNKEKSFGLTEGPMKADLFHQLTGTPTIAVPGVLAIKQLQITLKELKEMGVLKIYNLFDMDYITNLDVQKASDKIEKMIKDMGFKYHRPVWDAKYKGIDDYYAYKVKHIE